MVAAAEAIGLDGAAQRLLNRTPSQAFNAEDLTASVLAVQNAFSEDATGGPERGAAAWHGGQRRRSAAVRAEPRLHQRAGGPVANGCDCRAAARWACWSSFTALTRQAPATWMRWCGASARACWPRPRPTAAIVDLLGGEAVLRTWPPRGGAARCRQPRPLRLGEPGPAHGGCDRGAYINSLADAADHAPHQHDWQCGFRPVVDPRALLAGANRHGPADGAPWQRRTGARWARPRPDGRHLSRLRRRAAAGRRDVAHGIPADAMSKLDTALQRHLGRGFQPSGPVGQAVDLLGTVVRVPGRALVTEDAFFRAAGNRMELMAAGVPAPPAAAGSGDAAVQQTNDRWRRCCGTRRDNGATPPTLTARAMTFQQQMGPYLQQLATVMQHPLAKVSCSSPRPRTSSGPPWSARP